MTLALAAIACLTLITLRYTALCARDPFGSCRKCHGFGFAMTEDRKGRPKRGKDCRRCRGYGKRVRVGRWIYNRAQRIHRDGTR
ncbi:hypothetical protein C9F11_27515 [Streptomyces sp. YIM 121038]|uniref:hypothetical protein n=1 Tax=Streptomyces sp. YIM 121038 TaxID=2136401 RepID=UPI001110B2BB|nr:hypothetical protein [Streptomyces sp. YIM 121038]QCX79105.1 hypothetical protein C9F11_27515 [Streptomyces sp. YIM 121038]